MAQTSTESLPLGPLPAGSDAGITSAAPDAERSAFEFGGIVRTVLSLGFVIGLALLAGAGVKRFSKGRGGLLGSLGPGGPSPSGVLEIVGRYPVGAGQTLVLLRLDRRLLLLHQTTGRRGAQMRTLCEITDAEEIASVLLKARGSEDESVQSGFREAMSRLESDFAALEDVSAGTDPTHRAVQRNDDGDRVELLGDPARGHAEGAEGMEGTPDIVTLRSRLSRFVEGTRA